MKLFRNRSIGLQSPDHQVPGAPAPAPERKQTAARLEPRLIPASLATFALAASALVLPVFAAATPAAGTASEPGTIQQAARLNNIGTALMNQQLLERAGQKFAEAYAKDPSLAVARLNQGISLLYQQKLPEAEAALKQAAAQAPGDPRAWYSLGLLYRNESQPQQAIDAFGKVVALDPTSADSHYFIASLDLELSQLPAAVAEYQTALQLNPLHASAEFGLARALQRQGKVQEARPAFDRFQHLTRAKLASPLSHNYGEEGAYGRVEDASAGMVKASAMIPLSFAPSWKGGSAAAVSPGTVTGTLSGQSSACLIQLDGIGSKANFAMVVMGEGGAHIYRNTSEAGKPSFEELPSSQTGVEVTGRGVACAAGDYDNDGIPDLALAMSDRVLLFRNEGGGKFKDMTDAAGIRPANQPSGVTFVDYDHDGDLDLYVTGTSSAAGSASALYRNNGDKTFTNWTAESGLGGTGTTTAAVPSDINNDRAVDMVVANSAAAPTVFFNPREGVFPASPLFDTAGLPSATSIAILDYNKDGRMDVALAHAGSPGISLWRNVDGKRFEPVPLPSGLAEKGATSVVAIDFDNDGWIDMMALVPTSAGPRLRALRNLGPDGFKDVTADLKLDQLEVGAAQTLLAADVDGDGDADLILTGAAGATSILSNEGGNRNHALRIELKGLADNRSGIGTKVEVFSNGLWQKWEAIGQPEILAGMGAAEGADLVRLLWPTGVPQDELDVAAASKPFLLTEIDRRGSSCPTLFAWNGSKYTFVTDVIGAGVVGHWVSPSARNIPDPDEWVKVDSSQLAPRNGLLSLRFGEPMEEVNYVDQVRLMAVDHPAGTEVNPNEGFLSEPPFAQQRPDPVVLSAGAHPPAGAWDDHGRDVLAVLRESDHTYVRDFINLPYAGFANLHSLTLDLGRDAGGDAAGSEKGSAQPLRLLLHGFVEYFSASSMYSAWQAGIRPVPPYIEAQLPDGTWRRIVADMGFPAGLPRTVIVDLSGKLPTGSTRIRITTNLQLYWDQALVDTTPRTDSPSAGIVRTGATVPGHAGAQVHTTNLPLSSADLEFRGYPKQLDGHTPGDLDYDYTKISQTGPFIPQRGSYTRYGNVTPLLHRTDDEYVVFGTGEDMDLEFSNTALPPLPQGWVRDYFFYANGFVKDMDFYEAEPFTVDTLPFHGMSTYPYTAAEHYPDNPAHTAYQLEWNTRFESGTASRPYQFHYVPRAMQPDATPPGNQQASRSSNAVIEQVQR